MTVTAATSAAAGTNQRPPRADLAPSPCCARDLHSVRGHHTEPRKTCSRVRGFCNSAIMKRGFIQPCAGQNSEFTHACSCLKGSRIACSSKGDEIVMFKHCFFSCSFCVFHARPHLSKEKDWRVTSKNHTLVLPVCAGLVAVVIELASELVTLVPELVPELVTLVTKLASGLVTLVTKLASELVALVTELASELVTLVVKLASELVTLVVKLASELVTLATELVVLVASPELELTLVGGELGGNVCGVAGQESGPYVSQQTFLDGASEF